jgi:hypothetical protein
MASVRRRSAQAPERVSAAAHPPRANKLLSLLREKPIETLSGLGLSGGALGAMVGGLGLLSLRAREELLGLTPPLTYSKPVWLFTGFDALSSLLWRGLSVLASEYPILLRSAWGLLLLILAMAVAARTRAGAKLLPPVLGLSAVLPLVGTAFYRTALAPSTSNTGPSRGLGCSAPTSSLEDRAAFETCSWLLNDSPQNDARRSDLNGLLGWLLAACVVAILVGARLPLGSQGLSGLRWLLVAVHVLLALLIAGELPRAYAFGRWGLRYPQVVVRDKCDKEVASAIKTHRCWAFDVSAEAERKVVFLTGAGCPTLSDAGAGFLYLGTEGRECLESLSLPRRVIANGPDS